MPPPRRAPATAPAHPHDALFRGVFGHPQRAAELLRGTLPPTLTSAIDWRTLRPVDGSFVDARLRRHQADLVFLADVDGCETLLYLLLEHKSYEERLAARQLLRYLVELLCAFGARHPDRPLPPVVVYVLHHGNRAWQAPADLAHLFGAMPPALAALQPEFRFLVEDLSRATEAELRSRHTAVETLLPLLHLQQVRAARRRRGGLLRLLRRWRDLYLELQQRPDGARVQAQLVCYVALSANEPRDAVRRAFAAIDRVLEDQFMTFTNRYFQEGVEQGLEQGIERGLEQGLERGLEQGSRNLLSALLEQRFGALDPATRDRLANADRARLDRWAGRLLAAASLAEVFDD